MFGIVSVLPRGPYFTPNLAKHQPRLANKRDISETHGLPMISPKILVGTVGNPPPSGDSLLRTLIAAKDTQFSVSYRPSSRRPYVSDNTQPRIAKKGAISETHRLPVIFLKFRENHGQSVTSWGVPILNANRG